MINKQVEEGVGGGVGRPEDFVDWIECHTKGLITKLMSLLPLPEGMAPEFSVRRNTRRKMMIDFKDYHYHIQSGY